MCKQEAGTEEQFEALLTVTHALLDRLLCADRAVCADACVSSCCVWSSSSSIKQYPSVSLTCCRTAGRLLAVSGSQPASGRPGDTWGTGEQTTGVRPPSLVLWEGCGVSINQKRTSASVAENNRADRSWYPIASRAAHSAARDSTAAAVVSIAELLLWPQQLLLEIDVCTSSGGWLCPSLLWLQTELRSCSVIWPQLNQNLYEQWTQTAHSLFMLDKCHCRSVMFDFDRVPLCPMPCRTATAQAHHSLPYSTQSCNQQSLGYTASTNINEQQINSSQHGHPPARGAVLRPGLPPLATADPGPYGQQSLGSSSSSYARGQPRVHRPNTCRACQASAAVARSARPAHHRPAPVGAAVGQ